MDCIGSFDGHSTAHGNIKVTVLIFRFREAENFTQVYIDSEWLIWSWNRDCQTPQGAMATWEPKSLLQYNWNGILSEQRYSVRGQRPKVCSVGLTCYRVSWCVT